MKNTKTNRPLPHLLLSLLFFGLLTSPSLAQELRPAPPKAITPLSPLKVHTATCKTILANLHKKHYRSVTLDNQVSSDIFNHYFNDLDPSKIYFLQADLNEFETYRYLLDDALLSGNLEPAFTIFNRYQQRAAERMNYLITILDTGFSSLSFTADESF
ncbi:MAG: tail-specific protease, partial [Deltaproteobacteria bacterium]|nr:tail-specific protease [Deltaproteobacteria bacterium]